MENINLKERRILLELEKNARQSSSKIGKRVGLPWDVVNYRIKRLEERGIIKNYMTIIDLSKLGYQQYKICLQLQHLTKDKFNEMISFLKNTEEVKWIAECNGRYDLIISFVTKSVQEFNNVKNKIFSKYSNFISTKSVSTLVSAYTYTRSYIVPEKPEVSQPLCIMGESEEIKTDKTDIKILKLLIENARISIVELAEKLKISTRIVSYRIKQLEKNKIILGYRVSLDLEKFGYKFFKSFIYLENASEEKIKSLLTYCNQHPNIIHNVITIGNWELEPEFEVETNEKFYEIISEIRTKFFDIIKTIETIIISKEHKFTYV